MPEFHETEWEDYNSHGWDETPAWLWDDLTNGRGWDDDYGQMVFNMVFVDPVDTEARLAALDSLREWVLDEYGVDFDEAFDWVAWRDWYE